MVFEIIPFGRTTSQDLFDKMVRSLLEAHKVSKSSNGLKIFQEFETIVVCDESKQIPEDFTKIIVDKDDYGAGTLRNIGLDYVRRKIGKEDYFTFLDADDLVNENYYVIKNKADVIFTKRAAFVRGRIIVIDKKIELLNSSEDVLLFERICRLGEQVWGKMYISDLVDERFRDCGIWEDSVYSRRVMKRKPSITVSKNSMYLWRRDNRNSITNKFVDEENLISSKINLFELAKDNFNNNVFEIRYFLPGLRLISKLGNIPLHNLVIEMTNRLGIVGI